MEGVYCMGELIGHKRLTFTQFSYSELGMLNVAKLEAFSNEYVIRSMQICSYQFILFKVIHSTRYFVHLVLILNKNGYLPTN